MPPARTAHILCAIDDGVAEPIEESDLSVLAFAEVMKKGVSAQRSRHVHRGNKDSLPPRDP